MVLRSLRARVIVGSVFWTAGMLAIAHLASLLVIHHLPAVTKSDHGVVVGVSLLCMLAGFTGLRSGLSPFGELRKRLSAVRDGQEGRVDGVYPTEVQPLVNDLNTLLDHREKVVKRALSTAGDLAHCLKTPLALLALEAERAEAAGHREFAANISQQVDRMQRQVEYHLARARAAASGATPGAHCSVAASAEGLSRTLLRLNASRGLTIHLEVSSRHSFRGQREDLDEMLGNLLDNACKWAKSSVTLACSQVEDKIEITVDDDGAGLAAEMREAALLRGVRVDEAAPGSGFGLAIVRDLADLYGGSITLADSPSGGLRARLQLPASGESRSHPLD